MSTPEKPTAYTDERSRRYRDAIDSVLADDFLTDAVTSAVMAVVDAERVEMLRGAADDLRWQMKRFPAEGRHTRAAWAVAALQYRADEIEAGR